MKQNPALLYVSNPVFFDGYLVCFNIGVGNAHDSGAVGEGEEIDPKWFNQVGYRSVASGFYPDHSSVGSFAVLGDYKFFKRFENHGVVDLG